MKVAIAISIFFQIFSITMKSALAKELPEEVTVSLLGPDNAPLPPQKTATVKKSNEEWLKQLGPERFRILRTEGTEQPFCGTLLDNKKTGVYLCAGCELPLFSSRAKFHSGTGWPSFFTPFARENVLEIQTVVTECFAPKSVVRGVMVTWDTYFRTVLRRPGFAIA